jgi:predicted NBD/HSP70 family sugar kinase/biotin operon repressor
VDPVLTNKTRDQVLLALSQAAPCTRAEIAARTRLSRATVAKAVQVLISDGLIYEDKEIASLDGRGRRPSRLRWTEDAGLVAGIDIGHNHVTVAIATIDAAVIAERTATVGVDLDPAATMDLCRALVLETLEECGRRQGDLVYAAVGFPAPIAPGASGKMAGTVMVQWDGIDIRASLESLIGVRVVLENDANLGALAEHRFGSALDSDVIIYVKVSSGIGAGIIANGALIPGFAGGAGEIGHLSVRQDGRVCRCGNRGCLETVASIPSIVKDLLPLHPEIATVDDIVRLLDSDDGGAKRAVYDAGFALGQALASPVSILAPSQIVINGLDQTASQSLLNGVRKGIAHFFRDDYWTDLTVRNSTFGARNEILGAIQVAIESRQPARIS